MNDLHNEFRMGYNEYPKIITSAYDLTINCKVNTGSVAVPTNYGVSLVTYNRGKDRNVHVTDVSVILTRAGNTVECHIFGMNHYDNKFPNIKESDMQVNKEEQISTYPTSPSTQKNVSVNVTIEEEWVDDTDYSCLLFFQTTIEYISSRIRCLYKLALLIH